MPEKTDVYVFIDHSNISIEGRRIAKNTYAHTPEQLFLLRFDYGKLLHIAEDGRKIKGAILVGSRPPKDDTLWAGIRKKGIEPKIFDRSVHSGREKGVDAEMINSLRDVMEDVADPQVLAVVAGDGDYITTLERAVKRGWKVEIYFWSNANAGLKRLSGASFVEMDQYFPTISFHAKYKGKL